MIISWVVCYEYGRRFGKGIGNGEVIGRSVIFMCGYFMCLIWGIGFF